MDRQEGFIDGIAAAIEDGAEIEFDENSDILEGWPGTDDYTAYQSKYLTDSTVDAIVSSFGTSTWLQPLVDAGRDDIKLAAIESTLTLSYDAVNEGTITLIVYDCSEVVFGNAIPMIINAVTGNGYLNKDEDGNNTANDGCDPASWNNHGSIECFNGQWYVFYHRCSRGKQMYRRLCIEKIEILEDGSIPEVKMTSQGTGEPFTNGEIIYGYQACGLKGGAYITPDGKGSEYLTNIKDGDKALFRYVSTKTGFSDVIIQAHGSGSVNVSVNGIKTAQIRIKNGKTDMKGAALTGPCESAELELEFINPQELNLISITLV